MRIGIFDSGLGGLIITRAIIKKLPKYDYVYLGDTKRVPYGDRSEKQIYQFTCQALEYLFKRNCQLVIIACNTVSAKALRKIQREFLPKYHPSNKVLGVIIPTIETVNAKKGIDKVGIFTTSAVVASKTYLKEFQKVNPKIKLYQKATPLLVPLIEQDKFSQIPKILKSYLKPMLKDNLQAMILGSTHYCLIKPQVKKVLGKHIKIIDQTEIVPNKLKDYLKRHKEIDSILSKHGRKSFLVTNLNPGFRGVAKKLFGKNLLLKLADLKTNHNRF